MPEGAEKGVLGQLSPPAKDVRLSDTVIHQDTTGGNNQSLRALCGSDGGGFAAVWQDQRDGMLGLYLLRLDASGEPLEPERPIHEPHAGRRLDPAVALAPDGSGAVAWTAPRPDTPPVAWLRFFDSKGQFLTPDKPLGAIRFRQNTGPGPRRAGATKVTLIRRRDGSYASAWTEDGMVKMLEADSSGTWRDPPGVVNADPSKTQAGVRLGVEKGGGLLCAWGSGERTVAIALAQAPDPSRKTPEGNAQSCGEGTLAKLTSDPGGGFWGLFQVAGAFELRHLSPSGEGERSAVHPVDQALASADLAAWSGGLAFLAGRASGSLEVYLLGFDGRRIEEPPIEVSSSSALGLEQAQIASNGATLFVAWTDHRNGDPDVYGRTLDPAAPMEKRLGPERRLNSDTASADQINQAIAASGSKAVIVWQDERDREPHVYARLVSWPSGFTGDEFQIPVTPAGSTFLVPAAARVMPTVSMREEGDFLVTWIEGSGKSVSLRAQVFQHDGRPAKEPIRIQALARSPSRVSTVALPGDRGYLMAWDDLVEHSISAVRLAPDGTLTSEPRKIADAPKGGVQEPSIAVMEDDRLLAAWSRQAGDGVWSIAARFLDFDGVARGDEMAFERSFRGQDWDPSIAPASGGGFAMTWCCGAREDPGKDVLARIFDAHGRAAGPLLPISPLANEQDHGHVIRLSDGSWVVAWEDDISIHDEIYLRRIEKNGKNLGPIVLVNALETLSVPDRQAPMIAPLGDGIAILWNDRSRSKGWDVLLKLLGPRFDEVLRR